MERRAISSIRRPRIYDLNAEGIGRPRQLRAEGLAKLLFLGLAIVAEALHIDRKLLLERVRFTDLAAHPRFPDLRFKKQLPLGNLRFELRINLGELRFLFVS